MPGSPLAGRRGKPGPGRRRVRRRRGRALLRHSQRRRDAAVLRQRHLERRPLAVRLLHRRPDRRSRFAGNRVVSLPSGRQDSRVPSAHRLQDDAAGRSAGPAGALGALQPGTRWSFRDQPQSLQERAGQQALLRGGQSRPRPRLPLHLGHERPAWFRAPVRAAQPRQRDAADRAGRRPAEHPARGHAAARPDDFEQPGGRVQVDRTRRGHRVGRVHALLRHIGSRRTVGIPAGQCRVRPRPGCTHGAALVAAARRFPARRTRWCRSIASVASAAPICCTPASSFRAARRDDGRSWPTSSVPRGRYRRSSGISRIRPLRPGPWRVPSTRAATNWRASSRPPTGSSPLPRSRWRRIITPTCCSTSSAAESSTTSTGCRLPISPGMSATAMRTSTNGTTNCWQACRRR